VAAGDRRPRRPERIQLDVEGILAFAERVLPRASDLWVLFKPRSTSDSGSNSCSFRTESRSTEIGLLEPA
jgi:hypothetical protein